MKPRIHNWPDERLLVGHQTLVITLEEYFIDAFTDALWCIDGHERTYFPSSIPKDLDEHFNFQPARKIQAPQEGCWSILWCPIISFEFMDEVIIMDSG